MKNIHFALWLLPSAMLLIALLALPYGYYMLLRLVVCIAAGILAYKQYKKDQKFSGWVIALGFLALVFNPVIPVYLTREIWAFVDVAAAVAILAHFWRYKKTTAAV